MKINYVEKTDEEIELLAYDYLDKKIWTNLQNIKAFGFISYFSEEDKKELEDFMTDPATGRCGLIYEYLSEQNRSLANSDETPCFDDMKLLSPADTLRLGLVVARLEKERMN